MEEFDIFTLDVVEDSPKVEVMGSDDEEAMAAAKQIDRLLDEIKSGELSLATNYAKLGSQLLRVRSKKYWLSLGFRSFGKYVESVKERISLGRTQLYMFISVAEKLLPSVTEEDLNKMGITKALELQRVVVQTGRGPSKELVDHALDPDTTREKLRGAVFQSLNQPADEPATYFDFGGCYLTAGEREEIKRGFDVAERVDPAIPIEWPEHTRKKEVMLRFAREFLATYEQLVERGEG